MHDEASSQFQLGQLTGQVTALQAMLVEVGRAVSAMDARLRASEQNITSLAVKMAMIGIAAGGLGSFIMSYLLRFL